MTTPTEPMLGSLAFELGWLVGELNLLPAARFPTSGALDELTRWEWRRVAFAEVDSILTRLTAAQVHPLPNSEAAKNTPDSDPAFLAAIRSVHTEILGALAGGHPQLLAAYWAGQELGSTCSELQSERTDAQALLVRFSRRRVTRVRSWLLEAAESLPSGSAALVSRSLENWQTWANAGSDQLREAKAVDRQLLISGVHEQGRTWRTILSGWTQPQKPSVDAWLEAAEVVLNAAQRVGRKILIRFAPAIVGFLALVGWLTYLAVSETQGTTRVWTTLVTAAGGLGITGAGIGQTARKTASTVQKPLAAAAELEAQAWSVTVLPALTLSTLARVQIRRAGLRPASGGLQLERADALTLVNARLPSPSP